MREAAHRAPRRPALPRLVRFAFRELLPGAVPVLLLVIMTLKRTVVTEALQANISLAHQVAVGQASNQGEKNIICTSFKMAREPRDVVLSRPLNHVFITFLKLVKILFRCVKE